MSLSRQEDFLTKGRASQKQRTRDALINAAMEMARSGSQLAIAEVAQAARVSTATAYRYFPNPQSLWVEVTMRQARPSDLPTSLSPDIDERLATIIRAAADKQFGDEALWRAVLRATLDRWFGQAELPPSERVPVRGTARMDATRAAVAPLASELPPELLERLTMALNLVYGLEAMVTIRDVCGLDADAGKDVMVWAAQALVRAALAEASGG